MYIRNTCAHEHYLYICSMCVRERERVCVCVCMIYLYCDIHEVRDCTRGGCIHRFQAGLVII